MTEATFTYACDLDQLTDSKPLAVTVGSTPIAVVRQGDEIYAIHDVCSHAEVPLSEGEVSKGGHISCWLHGSEFDLRTGEPDAPPAFEPVMVFQTRVVRVDGKDVVEVQP